MKITFSNLGKIKKTTLDLRPLTVIIGPNNSNKTYIAYSIYGLWKSMGDFSEELVHPIPFQFIKPNSDVFAIKTDNKFYESIIEYFRLHMNQYFPSLDTYFQDSTKKLFAYTGFEVEVSKEEIKKAVSYFLSEKDSIKDFYEFIIKYDNELITFEKIGEDYFDEFHIEECLTFNFRNFFFENAILMPAERNAFIISYKMLETRRYRFLRERQRKLFSKSSDVEKLDLLKEQDEIRYPQPIEDFLDFLTDVELEKNDNRKIIERKKFNEIADIIEESIQEKNKTNFKSTKLGGKEIKINVKRGLDIDLYNASSSIKQLAPLLLYLRYRAKEGDLLIIDEPEMNLHPESQAKLLEVFGMLVNAGVNILLTTHSPYFMSHLNNLISGDTGNEKNLEAQAKSLYLKDKRAFLNPEDVSAYEMKNDKLKNLKHKDYGIRWDTLSDVSADIQQKFFEIYEKGDNSRNGEEK